MTTTAPFGVVPLLEGVFLALTSPGTKNLPHTTFYKSKVFDEVLSVLVLFLALRRGSITVKSKLLCPLGGKLGNDNIFP
uniref:Uncharacterized protein n=1 Tax=Oryza glumipatula TaxID=40148 RepID=A0A0E0AHB2_9ORYZ